MCVVLRRDVRRVHGAMLRVAAGMFPAVARPAAHPVLDRGRRATRPHRELHLLRCLLRHQ